MVLKLVPVICIIIFFGFSACNSTEEELVNQQNTHQIHAKFEHVEGKYRGFLPCADCRGIQTEIELNTDQTYKKRTVYLGSEEYEEYTLEGDFKWDEEHNVITLGNLTDQSMQVRYRVGEQKLTQLDLKGDSIAGDLADNYSLQKVYNDLTDRYWILIEVNGQQIQPDEYSMREAHLIMYSRNDLAAGIGSCNSFSGSFDMQERNQIQFSGMITTKMHCGEMELENQYFSIFGQADNYKIAEDTLSINSSDMASLARFVPVSI